MFDSLNRFDGRPALIDEGGSVLSYADLDEQSEAFARRLNAGRGVCLLECENSFATIVAFVAACRSNQPVLMVGAGDLGAISRLKDAYSILYHYRPQEDELRVSKRYTAPQPHPDLAILLSTSGSTGASKCVRLSSQNIESNAAAICSYLNITPNDRAITTLPFQYSYGMSVVASYLTAGAGIVLSERSVIDDGLWRLFDRHQCTSFSGVPHTFDLLERAGVRLSAHKSLRYATQAGGKLPADKVAAWAKRSISEGWRFYVMYGQTEASPRMAYLPPEDAAAHSNCIGKAIPGGSFSIVDDGGAEIKTGQGELVYRGPNVMMGYAASDFDLTRGAELDELRTGDIAERTGPEYYRIVGRKSRFIKPFGQRINLDEVESYLAARGVAGAVVGHDEKLYVFIEDAGDQQAAETELREWLGAPSEVVRAETVDQLPRTATGKVDYPALNELVINSVDRRDWGDRLLETPAALWRRLTATNTNSSARTVRAVFEQHFPGVDINDDHSFAGLGGDSLTYISMAIDLEQVIGRLPADWPSASLAALEAQCGRAAVGVSRVEMATFVRAAAIFMVIAGHLQFVKYGGGGATLLITVAGYSFASFQLQKIVETGPFLSIGSLMLRVAIPTMAYLLLLSTFVFEFDYRIFFLISNYNAPGLKGGYAYWFIEVYLQILAVIMILFTVPQIRRGFSLYPFNASVFFSLASIALFSVAHELWDTHYLFRRLPHMMLWMFAIGMAVHFASRTGQKIIVTALYFLGGGLFFGLDVFVLWMTFGVLALIWIKDILLPVWISRLIASIAGASLFIYLTHFQFGSVAEKLIPGRPYIDVLSALIGGVVVWRAYEAGSLMLAKLIKYQKMVAQPTQGGGE